MFSNYIILLSNLLYYCTHRGVCHESSLPVLEMVETEKELMGEVVLSYTKMTKKQQHLSSIFLCYGKMQFKV